MVLGKHQTPVFVVFQTPNTNFHFFCFFFKQHTPVFVVFQTRNPNFHFFFFFQIPNTTFQSNTLRRIAQAIFFFQKNAYFIKFTSDL